MVIARFTWVFAVVEGGLSTPAVYAEFDRAHGLDPVTGALLDVESPEVPDALMAALLSGLYALLFSLLRMEDFALLVGTGLVVAMMAVLMFVTRKLPRSEG